MYVHSHPIFGLPHLSWLCRINRQMDVVGNGSAASTEAVRGGAGAVLKAAPCQGVIFLW